MAGNGAIFDFGGTFTDGNRIDNLSRRPAWLTAAFRIAHASPGPKMPHQFFLEHPTGLDKQTAIDGFVGHSQSFIVREFSLQPSRDLLGRPIQRQLLGNTPSQPWMTDQATR